MSAKEELLNFLYKDEQVETVIFGRYGDYGDYGDKYYMEEFNDEEDLDNPIPKDEQGIILTWRGAQPYMEYWSFVGVTYGGIKCYPCYIWTTHRIIWVDIFHDSTRLNSIPRFPTFPDAAEPTIK